MKLILASGSERRNELLSWLGIAFDVMVSGFDEASIYEIDPEKLVKRLAFEKAKVVAVELGEGLVIGADTIVFLDGEIIGKPKDKKDAQRILRKLSGKTHWVYTGVCVINADSDKSECGVEKTAVSFRNLSDKEIKDYVATGEPLDEGGGYAIQMGAKDFVEKVDGSYTNVVGLPLGLLVDLLREHGLIIKESTQKIVKEKTGYLS